jgi:hypothetical protein
MGRTSSSEPKPERERSVVVSAQLLINEQATQSAARLPARQKFVWPVRNADDISQRMRLGITVEPVKT